MKLLFAVVALLIAATPFAPAEAQWVFVARKAAQRIHHMTEQSQGGREGYDFATMILEAPADRVFAIALDHARKNTAVHILMNDPGAMRLQVAQGDRTATLNVVSLGDQSSQLMIAGSAGRGEDSTSSRVVQAVMRICTELKKECEVSR